MRLKLLHFSVIGYFLLTGLILYIRYSPLIISNLISDLIFITILSSLVILLVYCSFRIQDLKHAALFLPLAISLVFIARAIPHLVLDFPPLADPYYHFIVTGNIFDYGTTESHVDWWYSQATLQLNWPMMQILTVQLGHVTGLDLMYFFRFLMPFIGVIFFFGIFVFAQRLFNHYGVSLLGALVGSLSATTIFYQSEFHPQGLALTLLVFIFIGFFSRAEKGMPFIILSLIFIISFTLSHHFSTLFLCLICIIMIGLAALIPKVPLLRNWFSFLSADITFLAIVVVAILSFYIYTNPELLRFLFSWSIDLNPVSGDTQAASVPMMTLLLNGTKWLPIAIVILAAPAIVMSKKIESVRALMILLLIVSIGMLGTILFFLPLDRLHAISMPIIGAISVIALFTWIKSPKRRRASRIIALAFISVVMVAGIVGSQTPAYFFNTSGPDPYYWYNNDLPRAPETWCVGSWSILSIERNSTYGITFASWSIPFYYGKNSIDHVREINADSYYDYYVINGKVEYTGKLPLQVISEKMNKIYCGPNIFISFNDIRTI